MNVSRIGLAAFLGVVFVFVSLVTKLIAETDGSEENTLTVLCYNVYNSFNHNKSQETATAWVKSISPDIAGWQELVDWDEKRLETEAPSWGHAYAAALKAGGYNIGLTSVEPIEVIQRRTQDYWHGFLHCRTSGIDVVVAHLWPGTRRGQLREAQILQELVVRLHIEGRHVILMGDFNAHSPRDKEMLDKQVELLVDYEH